MEQCNFLLKKLFAVLVGIIEDECYFIHCFLTIPFHSTQKYTYMTIYVQMLYFFIRTKIFCTTLVELSLLTTTSWHHQVFESHKAKLSDAMLNEEKQKYMIQILCCCHCPNSRKVNFIQHILDSYCLLTILGKLSRDMTIQLLAFRYVIQK